MKKTLHTILFFLAASEGISQTNLVPNPSFEDTIACPNNEGYINYATGWSSYGVSPDYFNSCSANLVFPSNRWGVPSNVFGYQNASTGNAYAGIIAYDKNIPHTDKEFIGRTLSQNLSVGQKYYVSFKVNLPKKDTSTTNQNDCAVFACNKLGLLFSNTTYNEFNPPPENNFAHIYTDSIITDTLNWVPINGSFVADSAYSNIIIGIFFDNNNVDTLRLFKPYCDVFAYYFIDDVCVSTDSLTCNQSVGLNQLMLNTSSFNFYPNPANNSVTINNDSQTSFDIEVYNTVGQLLYTKQNITADNLQLDISPFNNGLLFIKITSQNNQLMYKLLKQ